MNNATQEQDKPLYTADDVSEMMGLSKGTVWALCKNGDIPACKIGRRWFVPRSQFEEFLERKVSGR